MKKIKYYKKAFQNFGVLLTVILILGILMIPSYSNFYASVRENALKKYDSQIRQEVKMMENEINLQMNVLKNITSGQSFKILSNPPAYGYDLESVGWFESRESVQESYSVLKSLISLQDKSIMLFRNSDIQIDASGAADDFRAGYDTLWRLSVDGGKCSMDAAMVQLFYRRHSGEFDGNIDYNDIANGKTYELVYAFTLASSEEEEVGDSIFLACYDADGFIDRINMENGIVSVMVTTDDDKKLFSDGDEYDVTLYDSCYESENLNFKVYYSISDECLQDQLAPVNTFLLIVAITFAMFGFLATVGVSIVEKRYINRLVSVTKGTTNVEYSDDDDHIKYLETVFRSLYEKSNRVHDTLKDLIFSKILMFKPSIEELGIIEDCFLSPVCVVMFKNTSAKYHNLSQDVFLHFKEKNVELLHELKISESEVLFFIKLTSAVKEVIEDIIISINNERHADVRGIAAVCDDINKVPIIYDKIKKTIQYLEYGSLKFIKDYDENTDIKDFKTILAKSRQLYEIIRSGNEFEAKRIVYEQWYKITQDEINSDSIEPLFFSQTSILSQISSENKLNVSIPKFDCEKDAVSIAFEITECIEQICEKQKGTVSNKEDVRSSQIIEYIERRYCDSSFYMPELVGKFELSDRTIVQMLKKATGDNFSNYLSKLRIAKAADLLADTNMAISDVASASGFDSANSLYKAFKKVYGVSPTVYRENRKSSYE